MAESAIIGIDLAGPSNAEDTAVVTFRSSLSGLVFVGESGGSDHEIRSVVMRESESAEVVVGVDAPLSYQPGGGDRVRDSELRAKVIEAGLKPGSVMPPTMTRMVYLTLRGVSLTRLIATPRVSIVEVHPGATLALSGAPIEDVRSFRSEVSARRRILAWLETQGISKVVSDRHVTSHYVAACAAAFGAFRWSMGQSSWLAPAEDPFHPFDFAC